MIHTDDVDMIGSDDHILDMIADASVLHFAIRASSFEERAIRGEPHVCLLVFTQILENRTDLSLTSPTHTRTPAAPDFEPYRVIRNHEQRRASKPHDEARR